MGLRSRLHTAADTGIVNTENFDIVTYTGNGGTQSITSLNFQPDLVWVKRRSNIEDNAWFDSVRGVQKQITSNKTNAESIKTNALSSFDSNGYSTGANNALNTNNHTYVAWCWKAGGTAVNNTDGSVTSTVSANTAAGFSIVKFTTSGGTGTVGHGLNVTPSVVLMKRTNTTSDWYFFTTAIDGSMDLLRLNTTAAQSANSTQAFTSTTFKDWASSGDWIAYCFHSVDGHQKIGAYNGTGSSGNAITGLGFQPRFLMFKRTDSTGNWFIYDNQRGSTKYLRPDLNNIEGTDGNVVFDSDGFTINATYNDHNNSSGTYIYLAIA